MELVFILVEPAVPENIGASARALKTMGFRNLRLVNPYHHLDEKALWVAHGSQDILDQAGLFPTLAAAIADCDFIIATSAKRRRVRTDTVLLAGLPEVIASKAGSLRRVAVVFGREDKGLSNDDLQRCDILSTVPLAARYPSLNLAQTVMLYAYTLSPFNRPGGRLKVLPGDPQWRSVKMRVAALLTRFGLPAEHLIHQRVMERLSGLHRIDIHLLHTICSLLETNAVADGKDSAGRNG